MIGLFIGKIWVNVPIQYFEIDNEKIWVNVPIQYFEIYNQYGYNFLYSNSWFVLPRPTMNTHSPSVELEMITSIPIPDFCQGVEPWVPQPNSVELEMITSIPIPDL